MTPTYPQLTTFLDKAGTDGYLINADGEDSNQYYLSGYHAPDSFVTLYATGEIHLLVSPLEYTRAVSDSDGDSVRKFSEFDFTDKADEHGRTKAGPLTTTAFLSEWGVESVSVPVSFPTGTADVLHDRDIEVCADYDDVMSVIRAVKTDEEIDHIAATQWANEQAMAVAERMLERATVEETILHLEGEMLTSERIRRAIETTLLEEDCELSGCIVASGAEGAKAHAAGSGPIEAGEPVIVDIFPRNKESRYFGDMTRTFVKGEPTAKIREWYDLTREAYEAAIETIRAGVTGEAVDEAVCEVFDREGYRRFAPTTRSRTAFSTPPVTASGSTFTNSPASVGSEGSYGRARLSRSNPDCTNRDSAASVSKTSLW